MTLNNEDQSLIPRKSFNLFRFRLSGTRVFLMAQSQNGGTGVCSVMVSISPGTRTSASKDCCADILPMKARNQFNAAWTRGKLVRTRPEDLPTGQLVAVLGTAIIGFGRDSEGMSQYALSRCGVFALSTRRPAGRQAYNKPAHGQHAGREYGVPDGA